MTEFEIRQACERLLHDYAWSQDNGEPEAFAQVFAPDAVWLRPGGSLVGRQAILTNAQATFLKTLEQKALHCITNIRIDIDGDEATSTAYAIAFSGVDDGAGYSETSQPVGAMIYRDRFRLVDDEWKISQHETEFRFKS